MHSTRIFRANRSSVSALGQFVADFDLLQAELEKLRPGAKNVIAEPVLSADGVTIDWYVPGRVNVRPLDSAPPEDREKAELYLAELREQAFAWAEELQRSSDPDSHHLAAALKAMFTVPTRDFLFLVADQPVLAGWAYRRDATEEHRVGFHVVAPPPTPPQARKTAAPPALAASAVAATPVATGSHRVRRHPWLTSVLLALLLLLIGLILWLLLRACAIAPLAPAMTWLGLETHCVAQAPRINQVQILTRQLEDLERQVTLATTSCQPEPNHDFERRLEEARADVTQGEFEITLLWKGKSDLDLAVTFECAPGRPRQITFRDVNKPVCRGVLDKDFNRQGGRDPDAEAAEHITWAKLQDLPPGPMKIFVTRYTKNADPRTEVPYDLIIHRNGIVTRKVSGTASNRGRLARDRQSLVLTLEN